MPVTEMTVITNSGRTLSIQQQGTDKVVHLVKYLTCRGTEHFTNTCSESEAV
jgi:hypothetical protein